MKIRYNTKFVKGIYFLILFSLISQSYAQETDIKEDLEIEKLQKEIDILDAQLNEDEFLGGFVQQILALIGIVASAGVISFLGWIRERKIPPKAEQMKIFHEVVRDWYYHSFLEVYEKIWEKIKNSGYDDKIIEQEWKKLSTKKFDLDAFGYDGEKIKKMDDDMYNYLKKNIKIKKEPELKKLVQMIRNSADTDYYDNVFSKKLPELIENAIWASTDTLNKNESTFQNIFDKSLVNLRTLMILTRTREDEEVVKIMLRSYLYKHMANLDKKKCTKDKTNCEVDPPDKYDK